MTLRIFIPDTGTHCPGMALPRAACVRLNRLYISDGRFRSCLHKWVRPLCGLWVWRGRTNCLPFCPPMSTPSTHGLHGLTVLYD